MIKNEKKSAEITDTDDQATTGRVKQICQDFAVHSDSGLAHRLQQEEFAVHFDRNRSHRRESRLGVKVARDVEEEEKQAFITKQLQFYKQKQTIEEKDVALARQLQEDTRSPSNSVDRTIYDSYQKSPLNAQNCYEEIDQPSSYQDTSNDEQLARILQEEEQLLSSSTDSRSRYNSSTV